jgi:hypothetical protein
MGPPDDFPGRQLKVYRRTLFGDLELER